MVSAKGARIHVKWTKEEIGDSGWSPGWYVAIVQSYNNEDDIVAVTYPSEPGCTYEFELSILLNKVK